MTMMLNIKELFWQKKNVLNILLVMQTISIITKRSTYKINKIKQIKFQKSKINVICA